MADVLVSIRADATGFLWALAAIVLISALAGFGVRRSAARGRATLRRIGQRLGLGAHDGGLAGRCDGIKVEAMVVEGGPSRFIVIVDTVPALDGIGLEPETRTDVVQDVATGDPDFDRRVRVTGDQAVVLALFGDRERDLIKQAIYQGWTLGEARWSRPARSTGDLEEVIQSGLDLSRALSHVGTRDLDVPAQLEARFESDPCEEARAARLQLLITRFRDRPGLDALIEAALDDRHQSVILVAAREKGEVSHLIELACSGHASWVRSKAFEAVVKGLVGRPSADWRPFVERLGSLAKEVMTAPSSRHRQLSNLLMHNAIPGRLEVARRWLSSASIALCNAACEILALEGERDDLVLMRGLEVPPESRSVHAEAALRLRARLEAGGATSGGLALSAEGGALAVHTERE
ncbi:MAG TPA: hypothetical protein PK095_01640 [Myxococcota bacterium]|nr:hypothetical protein [Myxococcota bacterium]